MKLYLLKHKHYKTLPWNLIGRVAIAENETELPGLIAFFRLRDVKKYRAGLKKKYNMDYEIVKFESIERRRR